MEFVDLSAAFDCVPGVIASLGTDYDVGTRGENINNFSFSLVSPLNADNYLRWHKITSFHDISMLFADKLCIPGMGYTVVSLPQNRKTPLIIIAKMPGGCNFLRIKMQNPEKIKKHYLKLSQ